LVSSNGSSTNLNWSQDFVENETTGVILSVTQTSTDVFVQYTSTGTGPNSGIPGTLNYSITYLI